jgi:hypothetical protein
MRPVVLLVVALAVCALAAGCGGGEDDRSEAVARIAALCEEARLDVEALGLPSEKGPDLVGDWANRGRRLAAAVKKVRSDDAQEQQRIESLSTYLTEYYSGLRLAYIVYTQTKSSESYALALDRANEFLEEFEALAVELGADECAKRPFADLEPES